ncbi:MAG: molybdopterin-binding protein [Candidatus Bathyarchaeia archaeon]
MLTTGGTGPAPRDVTPEATLAVEMGAVAEDLASAAHLLMGEASEEKPVVLIKGAPLKFDDKVYGPEDLALPLEECVFMNSFQQAL